MEKKKVLWIAAAAMVIGAGGYGIYKVQDNRKREAAYQKAKDSLVLMLEENPTIECGTEIDDMNALALSYVKESHGDLSIEGADNIDTGKVGSEKITYTVSAKDAYGVDVSKAQTLEVKVVDTVAPEITLVKDTVELTVGDEFDPLTNIKSVKDKADGEIDKASLAVDNPVDQTKPGEYTVTVTAKDSANNTETKTYAVAISSKQTVMANKTAGTKSGTVRNAGGAASGKADETVAATGGNTDPWDTINGGIFDHNGMKADLSDGYARFGENSSWGALEDSDGNILAYWND